MISKEQLTARLEYLTAQARQMEQTLQAIGGAIQDCQYWLTQMENKDAPNQVNDTQGNEG